MGVGKDPPDPLESTQSDGDSGGGAPRAAGTRVGRYLLGEPLGQGGMGVVHRAADEQLGRAVAIKFLAAGRDNPDARARFLREARAASSLDHPNIGAVYEIGDDEGAPYIVMALYDGETLRKRLQRPLSVDELVAIALQLCRALEAAHKAGIVHRDLKPSNIMLLGDGTVKLLDFGLAKLTSIDESSLTRDGAILGTLAYMAPEQLKSGEIDARADLWALGAVIYEMLSGAPPFGVGPAATVVGRILTEDPPPLPAAAPPDLAAVCRRLLSKDPARRIASAEAVEKLLQRRERPRREVRGVTVGLAIVLLAAALGAAVMAFSGTGTVEREELPTQSALAAREIYERATRSFNLGRFDEAASGFQAAFDVSGETGLLYNIAQSYRMSGDRRRALYFFNEYRRKLPDSSLDAEVQRRISELSEATPSAAPDDPEKLGEQAYEAGRYDEAARHFEAAYERSGRPRAMYRLAESYRAGGHTEKALFQFKAYLRLVETDPLAERYIAELKASPSPAAHPKAE